MIQQLSGTGVALVTPFQENGKIDYPALERLILYVIKEGVDYIVTLGTTGETPTLSAQEKLDVMNFTLDAVGTEVPVVVGVGDYNTEDVIKRLETCPLDKAAAVLSVAPYYSKPSQEGLYQHYKAIAKASPKPVILYNVPGRTGRNMTAATTLRLAKEVENIIGVKEASGDLSQCMEIIKNKPADFMLVSGDDNITLPLIALGADGVISVAANYFARDFSALVRAALSDDYALARTFQYKLIEAFGLMFEENNPAGVKAFLTEAGIIKDYCRLPVVPVSDGLREKISNCLARYKASAEVAGHH